MNKKGIAFIFIGILTAAFALMIALICNAGYYSYGLPDDDVDDEFWEDFGDDDEYL